MGRRAGDPFEPGVRVWFRESPEAYTYSRANGLTTGVAVAGRWAAGDHLTTVEQADGTQREVPTAYLRSSPPRWLLHKERAKPAPKSPVRKEAIAPEKGTETTIFDFLEEA